MIAAGLLAKKALEAGLQSRPWVKTSLAPGSRVVTDYLNKAGLTPYLGQLGLNLVGYGCTTCIGNSGPLPEEVAKAVTAQDLAVAAVLSGNRNYEGRIHSQVKASYLDSPPLVVAYALIGTVLCDLTVDALGSDTYGKPVYLKDIWPSTAEIEALVASSVSAEQFDTEYSRIFAGDDKWKTMPAPTGTLFDWATDSTYIRELPFFIDFAAEPAALADIKDARALAVLGERPGGRMVLAMTLAAAAVTLLMLPNFGVYAEAPLGLALGLRAGLGWAVGTLILKHRAPAVPATVLTGWQLLIAGVPISIGALLLGDGSGHVPSWQSVALLAYVVLVPMAVGNMCWFAIVGLLPASVAGVSSILMPVVALVSGAIVHGEGCTDG